MSKHPKADLYLAERAKGLTYREISEKYGVSYQCVHMTCRQVDGTYKTVITEKGCIYPNLRRWLNEDRKRRDQFFRAMMGVTIRDILNGTRQPKKDTIDKMISLTGMTYEEMFKEDNHERKE